MPESERMPEPRARPRSTVSAWSSRVWPSRTAAAPWRSAAASRAAYRASRAAASGPPSRPTCTATASTGSRSMAVSRVTTSAAREGGALLEVVVDGDGATRTPSLRASKARAEARAMESAPPEQATRTSGVSGRSGSAARGAVRRGGPGERGGGRRARRGARYRRAGRGLSVPVEIGEDVVEYAADRQAYRRDRRMGTHVRCPSWSSGGASSAGTRESRHSECVDGDRGKLSIEHCTPSRGSMVPRMGD